VGLLVGHFPHVTLQTSPGGPYISCEAVNFVHRRSILTGSDAANHSQVLIAGRVGSPCLYLKKNSSVGSSVQPVVGLLVGLSVGAGVIESTGVGVGTTGAELKEHESQVTGQSS
jgi:hypothetical protein